MAKVDDLVNSVGVSEEDGITPIYPDTFRDDILGASAEDAALAAAELSAVTAQRDAAAAEVVTLKAYIADYIVGSVAEGDTDDSDDNSGADNESDDEPESSGVAGLFAKMAESTKD